MDDLKKHVIERYSEAAKQASGCCKSSCCSEEKDPISVNLYDSKQTQWLPEKALLSSLGCGNPTALAELNEGEIVLDLGSGGGIDVLLSAKRVGLSGKAIGLDMTDEMLELARRNQAEAGIPNAEFLKGEIENIPLEDNSVDVIISNCVINLSGDKREVVREAFRVLKPGGRFAVTDIVAKGELPSEVLENVDFWTGCVSGALSEELYRQILLDAGFVDVEMQTLRKYTSEDARDFAVSLDGDISDDLANQLSKLVFSGFIKARKP